MRKRLLSIMLALCVMLPLDDVLASARTSQHDQSITDYKKVKDLSESGIRIDGTPMSGSCGENLTWTLDSKGTLTISGTGEMLDGIVPWHDKQNEIKSVIIESGATNIKKSAFCDCRNLVNISIPNSITSIEYHAFFGCESLTHINIPDSVTFMDDAAFYGCKSLMSVSISNRVVFIAESAFAKCESLAQISIPRSVIEIGHGAFSDCKSLTNISIPDSITSIGGDAFSGCESLAQISIPRSVTSIGYDVFVNCKNLTDIYYGGTESEWNLIEINNGYGGNQELLNATIHYNAGLDDNSEPSSPSTDDDNKPVKPPVSADTDSTNTGILTFKDVRYYDTIAQAYVNVDLAWNWNDLIKGDSHNYNANLAKMSLALSAAIEEGDNSADRVRKILYGTDKEKRLACDEIRYTESISPAMAASIKKVKSGGKDTNIIFVVLRGTTTFGDGVNDLFSSLNISRWGISPVTDKLDTYLAEWEKTYGSINQGNTKFFVTGHSLGGACANLLAVKLSEEYGEENVFGYTFAAPSPFKTMEEASRFRGNIYNFLCIQDYVPSHFNFRDTWCGYGFPRWFNMCTQTKAANIYYQLTGKQWWDTHNANQGTGIGGGIIGSLGLHAPSAYMAYIMADPQLKDSDTTFTYIRVKCPVDVEVYSSKNELVGCIANNEIDYNHYTPNVKLIVCDGAKYVYFLDDDTYTIKITGTGDGIMTYTAASKDINSDIDKEAKIYSNVKISTGKKFRSVVSSYNAANTNDVVEIPDVQLSVVDNNGNVVARVLSDTKASASGKDNGTELSVSNNSGVNPGESTSGSNSGWSAPINYPSTTTKPEDNTNLVDRDSVIKVKKIKISGLSHKIAAGKKITLKATVSPSNASNKAVTWKSSNTKYATVDSKGVVTMKKAGAGKTVTITATAKDGSGKKATYQIKCMKGVVKRVAIFNKSSISLKAGKSVTLKAKVTASSSANKTLKWTSSNTKYASVTQKGKVTAKKAGKGKTVKITAMAIDGSGKKASVKIKIK